MKRKKKNKKDIVYILKHLREADKEECKNELGNNYIELLTDEIIKNKDYFVLGVTKKDNIPVCMGGVSKTKNDKEGVIWLLSTDEIVNHQICLLRNIKKEIEKIDKEYFITFNKIYKKNFLAKKWLEKFGYNFEPSNNSDYEIFYRVKQLKGLS